MHPSTDTPRRDNDMELLQDEAQHPGNPDSMPRPPQPSKSANALSNLAGSDTDSDDGAPVCVPRNKLVSRLQPQMIDTSSESDGENEEDGEGAYERVRKMLQARSAGKLNQEAATKEPTQKKKVPALSDSEEEEDMPIRANNVRRFVSRTAKSSPPQKSPTPSPPPRRTSPGLFVSPDSSPIAKRTSHAIPEAVSDAEEHPRLIREEQMWPERDESTRKARTQTTQESDSHSDGEDGRRLTQQSRPTRKAGKKAMLEMMREQQRISRNMQLTHKAKTKKKYGTKDLLAKFGFQQIDSELVPATSLPTPDASSLIGSSDVEGAQKIDTPPTSPPTREVELTKDAIMADASELPPRVDKGKGRAPESRHVPVNPLVAQSQPVPVPRARATPRKPASTDMVELSDSDNEFSIEKPKSRFPVFDKLPAKAAREAPSLLHLRHLAHLTSPVHKNPKGKPSMNAAQLQFSLVQKARQQAHKAREEKIEELKRRGIHIETEEEREKHQLEIEDLAALLEKARQEDLRLQKIERNEAKDNGEGDNLPSSDESEDGDYVEAEEADVEADDAGDDADLELSGSEEEEDDEEEEESARSNGLFDDAAEEDSEEEAEERLQTDKDEEEDADEIGPVRSRAARRARNVIVDDDDDSETEAPLNSALPQNHMQASTQGDAVAAAFGFKTSDTGLGLTQMFAGTMADMNPGSQANQLLDDQPDQDSLDFLRGLPDTQPGAVFSATPDLLVPNSQTQQGESQFTQVSDVNLEISQLIETSPAFSRTQLSQIPDPTQDAGIELSRSPAGLAAPPSTIDTVMLSVVESPVLRKKGKLRQRRVVEEESDAEDTVVAESEIKAAGVKKPGDAFSVLRKAAKKKAAADEFNKKTSWARDAIEEQAEESEDEYAGLGGASDEDSGEEDEELAKMIDSGDVKVDERKLAAHFLAKEKATDEKNINQLYKDLMNGGLRKRRGGDAFEMSDSEDEAQQRRRKKQAEFKQMQKALMSDERIGQIAQNPKQSAFFKTLADHDDDPDYEFLDAPPMDAEMQDSQSQSPPNEGETTTEDAQDMSIPDSQTSTPAPPMSTTLANPLKRKSPPDSQDKENRPPPHVRRTAASDRLVRKPMTFADVQHSITELIEDPHTLVPDSQPLSDSDSELEIVPAVRSRAVVNRLTLHLHATTTTTTTSAAASNPAFHAPSSSAHAPGFRMPALVRRATSNLSAASSTGTTSSSTGASAGADAETKIRRGGTGKSNIHAQAREAERRKVVDKGEQRRQESVRRMVGRARGVRSVLGGLGGGFE
ncbi:hypothetical protein EJ04DRAFT_457128, partial [Polyplosphaeria fusca]